MSQWTWCFPFRGGWKNLFWCGAGGAVARAANWRGRRGGRRGRRGRCLRCLAFLAAAEVGVFLGFLALALLLHLAGLLVNHLGRLRGLVLRRRIMRRFVHLGGQRPGVGAVVALIIDPYHVAVDDLLLSGFVRGVGGQRVGYFLR